LTTKKHSSLITTPQMDRLEQTGMLVLETGSDVVSNSETLEEKLKRVTLSMIPEAFKKDASESLMLRVYEIKYLMGKEDSFLIEKKIDKEAPIIISKMAKEIKSCTEQDVAVALETIASTFAINIPDKIGLQQYFKLLLKYPSFLLNNCINDILKTFPYPRLPVPKEFMDRLEPPYVYHLKWLQDVTKSFYRLEIHKQKAYINRTKED